MVMVMLRRARTEMRFRVVSFVCVQTVAVPLVVVAYSTNRVFFFCDPAINGGKTQTKRKGAHERAGTARIHVYVSSQKKQLRLSKLPHEQGLPTQQQCRVRVYVIVYVVDGYTRGLGNGPMLVLPSRSLRRRVGLKVCCVRTPVALSAPDPTIQTGGHRHVDSRK